MLGNSESGEPRHTGFTVRLWESSKGLTGVGIARLAF